MRTRSGLVPLLFQLAICACLTACTDSNSGSPKGGETGEPGNTGATGGPGDPEDTNETGGTGGTGSTADTGDPGDPSDTGGGAVCDPECVAPQACIDGICQLPKLCPAGTWICEGLTSKKQCNPDGTGFLEAETCPGDQLCSAGQCGLKCNLDPKWGAYVGCVFWTVDLPVWDDPTLPNANTLPHAVVISNPSEMEATVVLTPPPGVSFSFSDLVIPGSGSKVFQFPSMDTSGSDITDLGVRIESNRPVLVHQFNPWDNTYSNDASLLLPEPLLGQEHLILSWPTDTRCLLEIDIPDIPIDLGELGGPCAHSFLTVVAPYDNTSVTVRASAPVNATEPPEGVDPENFQPTVAAMPKGAIQTFTLNKGQVLNLDALPESVFDTADLTGTLVLSNKPVAVFSGHDSALAVAPKEPPPFPDPDEKDDSCCLDHLEEQMIPVGLLGKQYLATKSADRGGESDLWRIIAADDGVTITTTPPIEGIDGQTLAKKGDWIQAFTPKSFLITATGRIQVGQYLMSMSDTMDWTGDPSLILSIPVERYRSTYPIMVPPKYSRNYVTVARQNGTEIKVDGAAVSAGQFTAISTTGWEIAWIKLNEGFHTVTGASPFSLSAYGYNSAASYGYPGGMTIPGEANP